MPDIANGRERVIAFLKEKGIKKATLAVAYGFKTTGSDKHSKWND